MGIDYLSEVPIGLDAFEQKALRALEIIGININSYPIDHLCLRAKDIETIESWRAKIIEEGGRELSAKEVNGRIIYIMKLVEPVEFLGQFVHLIELPHPKEPHTYEQDGFEHFEVVIKSTASTKEEMLEVFATTFPMIHLTTLMREGQLTYGQPSVKGKQAPNPDVTIKTNGIAIKFHPMPIDKIVEMES